MNGFDLASFVDKIKNSAGACTRARVAALASAMSIVVPAGTADAQGYLTRDPNVEVDLSVLDEVGQPVTVPGLYLKSGVVRTPPVRFPPGAPPHSRLMGPLADRTFEAVRPAPPVATPIPPAAAAPPVVRAPEAAPQPPVALRTPDRTPPPPATARPAERPPAAPEPPSAAMPEPAEEAAARPDTEPAREAMREADAQPAPAPETAPPPPPATSVAATAPAQPAAPEARPPLTPAPTGPAPAQVAARTPAASEEAPYRILFDAESAQIADTAPLEQLADVLKDGESLRVQLMAYAAGTDDTASQARRLSLSRALAVRSFLINQGIRSTRMDVRALGNNVGDGPANRVDAVLVER